MHDASKLFNILVIGGMAMALPACSGDTTTGDDAAADDASSSKETGSSKDAGSIKDVSTADVPCLNKEGDCTHGLCSW